MAIQRRFGVRHVDVFPAGPFEREHECVAVMRVEAEELGAALDGVDVVQVRRGLATIGWQVRLLQHVYDPGGVGAASRTHVDGVLLQRYRRGL